MNLRAFFLLLFPVILSPHLHAQDTCEGNLGENIFEAGDFGSGVANFLVSDPGIAPGYLYSTSPPPGDGLYTITNNTALWNLYPSWLGIQDNSPDLNGYMMVVNASFDEGAFYEQQVEGLCENTLYEFSADMINLISQNVPDHIKPDVSFLIDGEVRYTTGEVPQNEIWNTYGFTFTTEPGQTEVTLTLRNNAPGGIGNDLALDNISFRACGPEVSILPEEIENICEDGSPIALNATITGDQYDNPAVKWQISYDEGATWQDVPAGNTETILHTELTGGFYYYRFFVANSPANLENSKCRIVSNNKIVYVQPKSFAITDTICEGSTYGFGQDVLDQTGTYVDSLQSSIGCDSIVTLNLAVVPDPMITAQLTGDTTACADTDDGVVTVAGIENAYSPVFISLSGAETTLGPTATFDGLSPGQYAVQVTDRLGCTLEDTVTVESPIPLLVTLSGPAQVALGDEAVINAEVNQSVDMAVWSLPFDFECLDPNCESIMVFPLSAATVSYEVTQLGGCTGKDSIRIGFEDVRRVYIPTAFSPNDDGRNDTFRPFVGVPNVQSVTSLQVFDRWGGMVYERTDYLPESSRDGWDGTKRGKPLPSGQYTYVAQVLFIDGLVRSYSGSVRLIR
ncbi:MAG: gliding motility-associated C-terminal domain-containing protein [Phaeodactylibacter sp.]|uniref:gliding motility-associated C-terminal domain-containing protein n=1 Tax=Phaeodactylibacter sp. TaxID=1940289 RepID=UPI0032EFBC11